jgi:RNA polymerase sigma-70 factor (ECF subfamily)
MNQVPDTQEASAETIEDEYRRQLLVQVGHRVRREFQETTWLAFWKTAVEGQPAKDVARVLHLTVGSVHTAKCRVIKRLGEAIRRMEGILD